MKSGNIRFTVELAGIPIEIACKYPENRAFFQAYRSEKTPELFCQASGREMENLSRLIRLVAEEGGREPTEPKWDFVENVTLNWLICEELVSYNILQVHGSAVCMDGEAYIFTAPSGTGKSTHARLWRETFGSRVRMINDDKPFVKIQQGKALAYGSPWDGKHHLSSNTSAPLKAIVHLTRGKENKIERISAVEAFPVVFRQAHTSEKPKKLREILSLEQQLLERTPCYRLRCNMSPEAALTAWRGMNENG